MFDDAIEISPAETERAPPILALPGEKERVKKAIANHRIEDHVRWFEGFELRHAPVKKAVVHSALVYFNGFSTRLRNFNRHGSIDQKALWSQPIVDIPKASYCLEDRSYHFFGHWLRSFAQCLLAEDPLKIVHFSPQNWSHAPIYEDVFGVESLPNGIYHVGEMEVFQDFAQGSHKAQRYNELRSRMQVFLRDRKRVDGKRVYLKRGGSGAARSLVNEDEVQSFLSDAGFTIVDVECSDPMSILIGLHDAELVISIEGSHVDHAHWLMRPGGVLCVLDPDNHFNTSQFAVANSLGNVPATLVIEGDQSNKYFVDCDRLGALLDLIDR